MVKGILGVRPRMEGSTVEAEGHGLKIGYTATYRQQPTAAPEDSGAAAGLIIQYDLHSCELAKLPIPLCLYRVV